MKKITIIILFLLHIIDIYAQNTEWIVYDTTNSGLPYYSIDKIAIDSTGNKWIAQKGYVGTTEAIIKFDGLNWTIYNLPLFDDKINFINSLIIDKYGRKWIGTHYSGLIRFEDTSWTEYNTSNSALPNNQVNCIAIDHNGNKWIGTKNGLAKFDDINFTVYNTSNSALPGNMVQSVAIDDSNNIWIGLWADGFVKFDGINWDTYLSSYSVISIAIDKHYNKWIGLSFSGLMKFDGINFTVYNTSNSGLVCKSVRSICIDTDGAKWISAYTETAQSWITCESFIKFDDVNWDLFDTTNSDIPSNSVSSVVIDKNGNNWIGTSRGLAVYKEGGIVNIKENDNNNIIPTHFSLSQNYPNPFNPATKINYQIPHTGFVSLKVYDILGIEVTTLVNENKPAGSYEVEVNGNNLSSGVYFFQLQAVNVVLTKKMVVLK